MADVTQFKSYWEKLQDARWQEKRLRVMEGSGDGGFTCMWCGAGKEDGVTLNVDHGYYKRGAMPWEYENDSLWCLCHLCHQEAGRLREELHHIIATVHPTFLKTLGMMLSEIAARLEPLRQVVRPRWSPIHCRRCGRQIGQYVGMVMRAKVGDDMRSFDDIYEYRLDDAAKASNRCPHCGVELTFEGSPYVDACLPSLPAHTKE